MNTELQNKVWSVLPKEFKEEVKEIYANAITHHPCGYNHKTDLMKYLFGRHNLTSDAEEEELLTCEKYKVEEALNYCDELDSISGSHNMLNWGKQMIVYLFGSKCLPDEACNVASNVASNIASSEPKPKPAEPKFKVSDYVRYEGDAHKVVAITEDGKYFLSNVSGSIKESDLEPYKGSNK